MYLFFWTVKYLLLSDMPVSETLAETTQRTYVNWRPKDEYEEAFNTQLKIQERAVFHGFMPKTPNSPIKTLASKLSSFPSTLKVLPKRGLTQW